MAAQAAFHEHLKESVPVALLKSIRALFVLVASGVSFSRGPTSALTSGTGSHSYEELIMHIMDARKKFHDSIGLPLQYHQPGSENCM